MILNSTVLPITPIVLKLPIGLIHQMPEMPAPQSTGNFCSTSTSGKPCSKSQPPLGHPPRIGPPSQHSHWGPPNAARAKIPHPWRTHGGAPMVAHPWWRTHGGAPMVAHPWWRTHGGAPMVAHPWCLAPAAANLKLTSTCGRQCVPRQWTRKAARSLQQCVAVRTRCR